MCEELAVPPYKIGDWENYLIGSRELTTLGLRIVCFNSGWFSKADDDKGNLWIGLELIKFLESENRLPTDRSLFTELNTVVIVHHPDDWLHEHERNGPVTRNDTMTYLTDRCHMILTGHTHGKPSKPDTRGSRAVHFRGGAAFAGADHTNSFRLVRIERDLLFYRVYEYQPGTSSSEWVMVLENWEYHPNHRDRALKILEQQSLLHANTTQTAEVADAPATVPFPGSEHKTTEMVAFQQPAPLDEVGQPVPPASEHGESVIPDEGTIPSEALQAVTSRIERDLLTVSQYRSKYEFRLAAEAAETLDQYLKQGGYQAPAEAADAYLSLYRFELEYIRHAGSSDFTRAEYYLAEALSHQGKAKDVG